MKKLFLLFSTFAFVFCLGLSTASAMGVGLSASTGSSTVDWTQGASAFSTDSDHTGFGFSMDTNLSRERMFNYRLEFSKSDVTFTGFGGPGSDLELDGIVLTNDFGFGARMSPLVRLWFGPELKFMWVDGSLSTDPTYNVDIFGAGLGAAVGINFNLPGPVTLSAKLAYVMMNYDDNDLFTSLEGEENLTYLTFTVFFRSAGDR